MPVRIRPSGGPYGTAWTNMIDPLLNGTTDDDPAAVLKKFEDEVNRLAKQQS